ncbi:MAG: hypothetical protein R2729_30065 [Bryobacteraceae bacterium]
MSFRPAALLFALATFAAKPPDPVHLTTAEDHARTLKLGIESLRRGANGRDTKADDAANYDESKANPYPELPDLLTLNNGTKVRSAADWWKKRRPEIVELFDREVYGPMPKVTPKVKWEVASTERETNGGIEVITKKLIGRVDNSAYPKITVDIELNLSTPADAKHPVPVVVELGYRFPPGRTLRPAPPGPTWQQVLAKGWGYASLYPTTAQADNGEGLTRGIIGLVNKGQPRKLDDWGALRAWAWGASRASPLRSSTRRALAASSYIAVTSANSSRTSLRRTSITGWPVTT